MEVNSVNKSTVQPTAPVKRKEPDSQALRQEPQSKPEPEKKAAVAAPRPFINTQGQVTGSQLNVTA
ncbi:MAG: hypothetical protein IPH35_22200 [Rhodoferax sp.]|nr:hypothetical protein [Rhodoferax sp.]